MTDGPNAPVTKQQFEYYKTQVEAAVNDLKDQLAALRARVAQLESPPASPGR